jgi:hypothetical protein
MRRYSIVVSVAMLVTSPAAAQVPDVPAGHPRVYVRSSDLPDVQAKLTDPAFADAWEQVQQSDTALSKAFLYLVEGDVAAGQQAVVQGLAELQACDDARVFDQAMHWAACIYDWCYDLLSDADKQAFIGEFERIAASHDPGYPADPASSAVVGHVTEGWLLTGQLPAGVAIHDEQTEMYDAAAALFLDRFVEVRNFYYPAHMHHQGDSYVSRFMHDQAASWLFRRIGAGDVLSPEQQYVPYQFLYHLRPDGQQMRSGDGYDEQGKSQSKRLIAMLTGSYYDDPYLLGLSDSDLYWNAPVYHRVLELLFRPAGTVARPPDDLPLSKYFAMPMGEMVARTGWTLGVDSPDTVVHMRIGGTFFGNHQRKDWGTFQVYHRGPLAISSGVYEGDDCGYGCDHWAHYHHQTIAHNALLVFDPTEEMTKGSNTTANDGGQKWPNGGRDHPPDLASLKEDGYDLGQVTAHAIGPDAVSPRYSYIAGDITRAYADTKVSRVTRSMVTLRTDLAASPVVFLTYDRVVSKDPSFKKTWLLHSMQEPTVEGSSFTVVRDEPHWKGEGDYDGKLVVDSLLPEGPGIAKVGGPGKEFWVESTATNYAVTKAPPAEPGAWRVEVSPSSSAAEDRFLHVMRVMEASASSGAGSQKVEGEGWQGGVWGGWGATFSTTGDLLGAMEWEWSGPEDMHWLACDLAAGWWQVVRDGAVVDVAEVGPEGWVLFVEGPAGSYRLEPGLPPDGGPGPDSGTGGAGGTGAGGTGGASGTGGSGGAVGTTGGAASAGGDDDGGCGCRVPTRRALSWPVPLALATLLGLRTWRRRRR